MSVSKRKCKWRKEKFQNSFLENAMKLSRGGVVGKTELRRSVAGGVGGKAECGIMTAKRRKYLRTVSNVMMSTNGLRRELRSDYCFD